MDDMSSVLKKAFEIYKEMDEIKEEEGGKALDAIDQISFGRYIESDPGNPVTYGLYSYS